MFIKVFRCIFFHAGTFENCLFSTQLILLTVLLSHQAAEFRQLWGSRSELRRFQDGEITEAVLWDGKSMVQKRMVPKQIITHLLHLYV